MYFSTYEEYPNKFQIGLEEILSWNGYGNVILRLTNLNSWEVISTNKNIILMALLDYNLLSTILFLKKSIEVFLGQFQMFSEICKDKKRFRLAEIVDDQSVI